MKVDQHNMNNMNQFKTLLQANQLAEANALLLLQIRDPSVVQKTMSSIVADHEFWKNILAISEIRIEPDGTDLEQATQPRYVNLFPVSFALEHMNTLDDVMRYVIHGGAHFKCEQLWRSSPVPMNSFNELHLAWIEDIYGQRFVQATAPLWHVGMPITALTYFEFHRTELTNDRQQLVYMLTDVNQITNPVFSLIRQWLYSVDPLQQESFNSYMRLWLQAYKDPQFVQLLNTVFV
jgi:hypothetical protein